MRRGYFVDGLGAAQFARAGVEERLRGLREPSDEDRVIVRVAALDPANPYGSSVPWPKGEPAADDGAAAKDGARLARAAGAHVILLEGRLIAYLSRGEQNLTTFLTEEEPSRSRDSRALARELASWVERGSRKVITLQRIDGGDAAKSALAVFLKEAGFTASGGGLMRRREGTYSRR